MSMSEQYAANPLPSSSSISRRMASGKAREREALKSRRESILELTEAIREAYMDWQNALINFENAECSDMVDYYTYCIKATQIRYEYLLRKAKQAQVQ